MTYNWSNKTVYIKKLGEGGFGSLQLYQCKRICTDLNCNKCVVIKTMKRDIPNFKSQEFVINHFYREYQVGFGLNHPNIRKTFALDKRTHSIIFEYCPGMDLFDLLDNISKSEINKDTKFLLSLFSQILDGVEYLHNVGVAHLDLKLENIIISSCDTSRQDAKSARVKIIDFGEALVYKTNNKEFFHQGLNGTLQYMPPEMLQNKPYRPDKVDIWSCGILLYNIIYNYMPWDRADSKVDQSYNLFQHNLTYFNTLNSFVFKDLGNNYSVTEKSILSCIFKHMLQINPDDRKSISMIKDLFNLIKWENENEKTTVNNKNEYKFKRTFSI